MLGGRDLRDGRGVALGQRRKRPLGFLLALVAALRVYPAEAVEERARRRRPEVVPGVREVDGRRLELLLGHLARQGALPDQSVEACLVAPERPLERLRLPRERRGPDRLVGLLGVAGRGAVAASLGDDVRPAVARVDHGARLDERLVGEHDRIRSHVRDAVSYTHLTLPTK